MLDRKGFSVHFVREKSIGIEGFRQRDGTLEIRHGAEGNICTVEQNFAGGGFHAGVFEHVGQTNAAPARVAHGSVAPLHARHGRLIESPAVPGALEYADELGGGQFFQIVHGQDKRCGDRSADIQAPVIDVYGRHVDVRTDKKMLSGSKVVYKAGKRHLQILGADGANQHVTLGAIVGAQQRAGGKEQKIAAFDAHEVIVNSCRHRVLSVK
jgi:hypothetical protein